MDCSTPGLPVHHQLLESTQIHVHWVSDAIQPSHPTSSPRGLEKGGEISGPWWEAEKYFFATLIFDYPILLCLEFISSGLSMKKVSTWKFSGQRPVGLLHWLLATENRGCVVLQLSAIRIYSPVLSHLRLIWDKQVRKLSSKEFKYLAQVYTIGDFFPSFVPFLSSCFSPFSSPWKTFS